MATKLELVRRIAEEASLDKEAVFKMLVEASAAFFPVGADKIPLIREWQKVEAVDSDRQGADWLRKWPNMLIGLPTGANGLFVVDLDKAKHDGEVDGLPEFQKDCEKHGYDFMAATLCSQTPSGGLHIYYATPADCELRTTVRGYGKTPDGKAIAIDTRGKGGFIIFPPSKREEGVYQWLNHNPIAELPGWLLERYTKKREQFSTGKPYQGPAFIRGGYVNERERRAYEAALNDECDLVASAAEGCRNNTLNTSALKLARYVGAGKLDEGEVYDKLYRAAQYCGLDSREIMGTLHSAISAGKLKPKEIEPHGGSWESGQTYEGATAPERHASEPRKEDDSQGLEEYRRKHNAKELMRDFYDEALKFSQSSAISTGFKGLDAILDGGLNPWLYCIGAVSSLGKTTFTLQMGDTIAEGGHDVLIFSLEMSGFELMAKSLSRLSRLEALARGDSEETARTARYFLTGGWGKGNSVNIDELAPTNERYTRLAEHIYFVEGDFAMNALTLADKVKKHIKLTGRRPVVIVDYLQILAPLSAKATDKQNTDRAVVELKRISRDFKIPVIAVSSLNRESYSSKVTMASFKESGAIEYTSDVLIGLNFRGVGDKSFDVDAARQANPREISLSVLKNRYGRTGEVGLKYYPRFNLFQDC